MTKSIHPSLRVANGQPRMGWGWGVTRKLPGCLKGSEVPPQRSKPGERSPVTSSKETSCSDKVLRRCRASVCSVPEECPQGIADLIRTCHGPVEQRPSAQECAHIIAQFLRSSSKEAGRTFSGHTTPGRQANHASGRTGQQRVGELGGRPRRPERRLRSLAGCMRAPVPSFQASPVRTGEELSWIRPPACT